VYRGFLWGKVRERNHLEDTGVDGRIILKWVFEKCVGGHGLNQYGSGYGQVAGSSKRGNQPSASTKSAKFPD
jgi:hypothetical protein